jgi:hypothetical protein
MAVSEQWQYREMGSRNKKTGELRYYLVTVRDFVIIDCECEARQFRRFSACKHMKRLQKLTGHLTLK